MGNRDTGPRSIKHSLHIIHLLTTYLDRISSQINGLCLTSDLLYHKVSIFVKSTDTNEYLKKFHSNSLNRLPSSLSCLPTQNRPVLIMFSTSSFSRLLKGFNRKDTY